MNLMEVYRMIPCYIPCKINARGFSFISSCDSVWMPEDGSRIAPSRCTYPLQLWYLTSHTALDSTVCWSSSSFNVPALASCYNILPLILHLCRNRAREYRWCTNQLPKFDFPSQLSRILWPLPVQAIYQ